MYYFWKKNYKFLVKLSCVVESNRISKKRTLDGETSKSRISNYLDKEYARAHFVREYLQERSTGRPS